MRKKGFMPLLHSTGASEFVGAFLGLALVPLFPLIALIVAQQLGDTFQGCFRGSVDECLSQEMYQGVLMFLVSGLSIVIVSVVVSLTLARTSVEEGRSSLLSRVLLALAGMVVAVAIPFLFFLSLIFFCESFFLSILTAGVDELPFSLYSPFLWSVIILATLGVVLRGMLFFTSRLKLDGRGG